MKKLLIIGGTSGIGNAIAKNALTDLYKVIVTGRRKPINSDFEFFRIDINMRSKYKELLSQIKPNILIISAAKGLYGNMFSISEKKIVSCVNTTFLSNIYLIKEAIRVMPQNSSIGWISSLTAIIPNEKWAVYSAAKSGVEHFLSCIQPYADNKNISITICYPGSVATEFHVKSGAEIPIYAVSANKVSQQILKAIVKKKKYWSAKVDKKVISEFQIVKNLQKKYKTFVL